MKAKQILLSLAIFFSANNFSFAENKFLKERRFFYITIEASEPKINDPNIDMSAGYWFTLGLSIEDNPMILIIGLCKTSFLLGVDVKLPPTSHKSFSSSGSIRVSPTSKIKLRKGTWRNWYEFTDGEVFINFPTAEEKAIFERYLAERRKKYCPPVISRRIP